MKIRYNAPITLTFAIIAASVLLLDQILIHNLIESWFLVPGRGGFNLINILHYPKLFTHSIGHADWSHFLGNFSFILLLGPILEEKYGKMNLLFMMLITAFITGLINIIFFTSGLYGASGIVFMMILLSSFTNIRAGEIPLTFILVVILFLLKEIFSMFDNNNISEMAHIIGGVCGAVFGFMQPARSK